MTQGPHSRLAKPHPGKPLNQTHFMALIVQKYGGTSVGDVDRIKNVAKRIQYSREEGHSLVVVVSARSGVTNELIARAKAINERPDTREMDMLLAIGEQETIALTAMALHAIGIPAVSYTGAQAGIFTDEVFTKAKIQKINCPSPSSKDLKAGKVVIVAGFQGINDDRPDHDPRPRRLRPHGHRAGGGAARPTSLRDLHRRRRRLHRRPARRPKPPGRSRRSATTRCWNSPASARRSCTSRSVEFAKKYGVDFRGPQQL